MRHSSGSKRLKNKYLGDWGQHPFRTRITKIQCGHIPTPCWKWSGAHDSRTVRVRISNEVAYVRRIILQLTANIPSSGLHLTSICRNVWCVSPHHHIAMPAHETRRFGRRGGVALTDLLKLERGAGNLERAIKVLSEDFQISEVTLEQTISLLCAGEEVAEDDAGEITPIPSKHSIAVNCNRQGEGLVRWMTLLHWITFTYRRQYLISNLFRLAVLQLTSMRNLSRLRSATSKQAGHNQA